MKVLIADDHALVRAGLRGELETLDAAVAFVEASDEASLREAFRVHHDDLDLAIVDLTMPGMEHVRTIASLRSAYPVVPIIVLSAADPAADAIAVLRAGAAGFIPKSGMSSIMLQAIRLVLAGGEYLPPQLKQALVVNAASPGSANALAVPSTSAPEGRGASGQAHAKGLDLLSERQRQVFALLAEGLSNKAIARRLGITEGTVKTHVATIFDLLNVHNRVSAVIAARALAPQGSSK